MRKNIILLHLLMLVITVNIFSQSLKFSGTNNYVNLTNNAALHLSSFTLEAWVKPEGTGITTNTGSGGTTAYPIITKGRGEADAPANLNVNYFLGIDVNRKLTADFEEGTGSNHPVVSTTSIPDSAWTHVAVTYEPVTAVWKLYINGKLNVTKDLGSNINPANTSIQPTAMATAMNSTGVPAGYFKGKIDEVRIWNIVRTDSDIVNHYKVQLTSGTGLVARYGLNEGSGTVAANTISSASNGTLVNSPQWSTNFNLPPDAPGSPTPANAVSVPAGTTNLCVTVSDPNKDQLRVRFYGRKKATTGKFTIVLLPDTQYYVTEPQGDGFVKGGYNFFFKSQTKWIANNRISKNIVYVGQLGDCVDQGDTFEVEWKRADTAIRTIEDPTLTGLPEGIPYSICVGNHDQTPNGNPKGTTMFYNQYFGTSRFSGRSYYGGHNATNNDNHYELFSASGIDFLVLCPEFDETSNFYAPGSTLDWMESLVKKYPNRKVIVLTHFTIRLDNSFGSLGSAVYNRLKVYPNFILFAGGHIVNFSNGDGEARRTDTYNGNVVQTTLQDYQARVNGGNGLLRIYEFDPANNNVAVKTYSPYTNTYETDANSQFNLSMKLTAAPAPYTLIGELSNVTSGSKACISWPSLAENTVYEWYAEVYDADNKITSPTWSFTTTKTTAGIASSNNVTEQSTLVGQQGLNNLFTIYPNPNSNGHLTLAFSKEVKGVVSVEAFDAIGHLQLQKKFKSVSHIISFEHRLAAGTYILVVKTKNSKEVSKLVVIK